MALTFSFSVPAKISSDKHSSLVAKKRNFIRLTPVAKVIQLLTALILAKLELELECLSLASLSRPDPTVEHIKGASIGY
jgi:hypothetical protein